MTAETFRTQRLDHLGIVAVVCDRIDLINTIDTFIGPTQRKVSVGESIVAMVLNALGFVSRPLYLTPEFFSNKPVDRLSSPPPYFVADSALYTTTNLTKLSDVRFITRVPETLKAVKDLYQSIPVESMQPAALQGYRYQWVDSTFGDVPQRGLVVYSQAAFDREGATLEKQIAKAKGVAETSLKRVSHKTYDTAEAAEATLAEASKSWKYHTCCFSIDRVPHSLLKFSFQFRMALCIIGIVLMLTIHGENRCPT